MSRPLPATGDLLGLVWTPSESKKCIFLNKRMIAQSGQLVYNNLPQVFRKCGEERAKVLAAYEKSEAAREVTLQVNANSVCWTRCLLKHASNIILILKANDHLNQENGEMCVGAELATPPVPLHTTNETELESQHETTAIQRQVMEANEDKKETLQSVQTPVASFPVLPLKSPAAKMVDTVPGFSGDSLGEARVVFEEIGNALDPGASVEESDNDQFSPLWSGFLDVFAAIYEVLRSYLRSYFRDAFAVG